MRSIVDVKKLLGMKLLMHELTGVSPQRFTRLLPAFQKSWQEERLKAYLHDPKRKRKPTLHGTGYLSTMEDKLFFGLFYYRLHPSYSVLRKLFSYSTGSASRRVHALAPVLERTLGAKPVPPKTKIKTLAAFFRTYPAAKKVFITAAEEHEKQFPTTPISIVPLVPEKTTALMTPPVPVPKNDLPEKKITPPLTSSSIVGSLLKAEQKHDALPPAPTVASLPALSKSQPALSEGKRFPAIAPGTQKKSPGLIEEPHDKHVFLTTGKPAGAIPAALPAKESPRLIKPGIVPAQAVKPASAPLPEKSEPRIEPLPVPPSPPKPGAKPKLITPGEFLAQHETPKEAPPRPPLPSQGREGDVEEKKGFRLPFNIFGKDKDGVAAPKAVLPQAQPVQEAAPKSAVVPPPAPIRTSGSAPAPTPQPEQAVSPEPIPQPQFTAAKAPAPAPAQPGAYREPVLPHIAKEPIFEVPPQPENTLSEEELAIMRRVKKQIEKPIEAPKMKSTTEIKKMERELSKKLEEIRTKINQQLARPSDELSIIEMVEAIIQEGYYSRASDVHIEPQEKDVVVRLRVDGVLHDVVTYPRVIHSAVITRIKVISGQRTDEHQAAQDGRFKAPIPDVGYVDIRVSIAPTYYGENAIMRILTQKEELTFEELGLREKDLEKVNLAAKRPFGMILSCGPTGSGKTTTLYAIIKLVNKRDISIITIEDPIEYSIEGIDQIQVNAKTGLTFAAGLRALLRQDPDIIMVGEIRDEETAGIAVNASLTGHLLLSTLHTNDAATALPRLADMGIEPFLVASTVNVIIGQRLVRRICENCKVPFTLTDAEIADLTKLVPIESLKGERKFYRGKGCIGCGQSGYKGRVGIFEVLEITENIKTLIMTRASSADIKYVAMKNGMTTMLEDGIRKATAGHTSIEEILRVARE